MLQVLLRALLSAFLGVLAQWIQPLISDLLAGPIDASFLERLYAIVFGVEKAHPDAPGKEKREMAFSATKALQRSASKYAQIDDSQLNTMIELAVRKMRLAKATPGQDVEGAPV